MRPIRHADILRPSDRLLTSERSSGLIPRCSRNWRTASPNAAKSCSSLLVLMLIFRRDRDRSPPILAEGAVRPVARPQPSSPTPEEEFPAWVMSSVQVFLESFFAGNGPWRMGWHSARRGQQRNFVREIERTCQIPVPWQNGPNGAANGVWQVMYRDRAHCQGHRVRAQRHDAGLRRTGSQRRRRRVQPCLPSGGR
jgi:hypothetical protein